MIVRATEKDAAKALFGELGIKIVSGHRFLGGFVGEKDEVHDFVLEKVTTWTSGVIKLAEAAEFYPQAAFAALSKSMQFQWSYLQRVLPDCDSCFEVLCNALSFGQLSSLEMHFHYVIIGLFLKRQRIVMVEKNSASNMLLIVKKVALLPSAIMKCEML